MVKILSLDATVDILKYMPQNERQLFVDKFRIALLGIDRYLQYEAEMFHGDCFRELHSKNLLKTERKYKKRENKYQEVVVNMSWKEEKSESFFIYHVLIDRKPYKRLVVNINTLEKEIHSDYIE